MDKTPDALAQLRDIHLPTPISWWPMAWGWYLLMALLLCSIIMLTYRINKRIRQAKAKKQALGLLKRIQLEYKQNNNSQLACAHISEILKRVALVYYPRLEVASLHGENWIAFLNDTGKGIDFKPIQSLLLELPFKPSEPINLQPLFQKAEHWIRQRRKPCSS